MLQEIEKGQFHLYVVNKMQNKNPLIIIEKDMNKKYKNK